MFGASLITWTVGPVFFGLRIFFFFFSGLNRLVQLEERKLPNHRGFDSVPVGVVLPSLPSC